MTRLIIIGGGNSISDFPTLWDDIKGLNVMSINYVYRFLKETPKYQISMDRKFWKNNYVAMNLLQEAGCEMINRNKEYVTTQEYCSASESNLFCGRRKLSGIFALSYVTRKMHYDKIYLFGYDFGVYKGKTHFHNISHSGNGKESAYLDENKNVLDAVNDFEYFKAHNINIVGFSNIKALNKITYNEFKEGIKCQI